jgi:multiple sugar transport system substrate-binding protein
VNRSRRPVALLLALFALVGVASSCSSGDDATVVRVQVEGEPEDTAIYQRVAEAYEREHPDVDVRLETASSDEDHLAKLTTSFAAGNPPDVFLINYREFAQFVGRDAIEPIGPHLPAGEVDGYYPAPIEAFTVDGRLQCIPQNTSSLVVYYNRTLFAQAGLGHPESWSWQQFRDAAVKLTTGEVRGLGIRPSIIRVAPFVWSNGGELVDDPVRPTRFTLDQPASREALEFVLRLVRDDKVSPTETELAAQGLEERFEAGKLGMLLSSRRDTPRFREVKSLDWDVAPLPTSKQPAGILHSDAFCVAARSRNRDEAVAFARFGAGEPGQRITTLAGRLVPSLKSVVPTSYAAVLPPPAHGQVFVDAIPNIRRTPVLRTWAEIEEVSGELLTRAFHEPNYTVDHFLRELDAQTRPLFREAVEDR